MNTSPNLDLSYLAPNQAQKHVTVNESLRRLDTLVQLTVESSIETSQPAAPQEGARWILPEGATGSEWDTFETGAIAAFQDGAWQQVDPLRGWRAWSLDTGTLLVFDSSAWVRAVPLEQTPLMGVNTTAEETSRLSVKSDSVLFSHDDVTPGSGNMRLALNKASATDTASLLFQDGYEGRAEIGLTGNDVFNIKVRSTGSDWRDAVQIEGDSGFSVFGGHLGVEREAPADLWLSSGGLFTPQGMIGSNGSFGFGIWYNGYRNQSGGWTSQVINSSDVAGAFELQKTACLIRFEDTPAAAVPEIRVRINASEMSPGPDNAMTLGSASSRWSEIYAASGTIATSDKTKKQIEGKLDQAERRVARRILDLIVKYRWKDALAQKGESARLHVGVTAQDVYAAFADEGLDAACYGIWCEDAILAYSDDPETGLHTSPTGETLQGLRYEELMLFLLASLL